MPPYKDPWDPPSPSSPSSPSPRTPTREESSMSPTPSSSGDFRRDAMRAASPAPTLPPYEIPPPMPPLPSSSPNRRPLPHPSEGLPPPLPSPSLPPPPTPTSAQPSHNLKRRPSAPPSQSGKEKASLEAHHQMQSQAFHPARPMRRVDEDGDGAVQGYHEQPVAASNARYVDEFGARSGPNVEAWRRQQLTQPPPPPPSEISIPNTDFGSPFSAPSITSRGSSTKNLTAEIAAQHLRLAEHHLRLAQQMADANGGAGPNNATPTLQQSPSQASLSSPPSTISSSASGVSAFSGARQPYRNPLRQYSEYSDASLPSSEDFGGPQMREALYEEERHQQYHHQQRHQHQHQHQHQYQHQQQTLRQQPPPQRYHPQYQQHEHQPQRYRGPVSQKQAYYIDPDQSAMHGAVGGPGCLEVVEELHTPSTQDAFDLEQPSFVPSRRAPPPPPVSGNKISRAVARPESTTLPPGFQAKLAMADISAPPSEADFGQRSLESALAFYEDDQHETGSSESSYSQVPKSAAAQTGQAVYTAQPGGSIPPMPTHPLQSPRAFANGHSASPRSHQHAYHEQQGLAQGYIEHRSNSQNGAYAPSHGSASSRSGSLKNEYASMPPGSSGVGQDFAPMSAPHELDEFHGFRPRMGNHLGSMHPPQHRPMQQQQYHAYLSEEEAEQQYHHEQQYLQRGVPQWSPYAPNPPSAQGYYLPQSQYRTLPARSLPIHSTPLQYDHSATVPFSVQHKAVSLPNRTAASRMHGPVPTTLVSAPMPHHALHPAQSSASLPESISEQAVAAQAVQQQQQRLRAASVSPDESLVGSQAMPQFPLPPAQVRQLGARKNSNSSSNGSLNAVNWANPSVALLRPHRAASIAESTASSRTKMMAMLRPGKKPVVRFQNPEPRTKSKSPEEERKEEEDAQERKSTAMEQLEKSFQLLT